MVVRPLTKAIHNGSPACMSDLWPPCVRTGEKEEGEIPSDDATHRRREEAEAAEAELKAGPTSCSSTLAPLSWRALDV